MFREAFGKLGISPRPRDDLGSIHRTYVFRVVVEPLVHGVGRQKAFLDQNRLQCFQAKSRFRRKMAVQFEMKFGNLVGIV
jgi:hypothetical protein